MTCLDRDKAYEEAAREVAETNMDCAVHIGVGDEVQYAKIVDSIRSFYPYTDKQIAQAIRTWVETSPDPEAGAKFVRCFKGLTADNMVIAPFDVQVDQNGYLENFRAEDFIE